MRISSWLFCAIALYGQTTAFYPYKHPNSVQEEKDQASTVNRRKTLGDYTRSEASIRKKSLKLRMKRRAPPANVKAYDWSIVETNAMARREYRHPEHHAASLVKRDNNFNVVTAVKPSQTNSAPIDEDGTDFSYFAPLSFGSRDTSMYMLVDTGAANTWVMGSNCTTEACEKHNTFGEADSATYKPTGETFNLTYGTGSVSGVIINDTVQIAGMSIPLSFGAASTTSDDFLDYPMDGILGLGRSASNTMQFPTVMQAIMDAAELQANIFGVNLQRDSDGYMNGELNLGAPDISKYVGDLSWTATISKKLWEIPVDDSGFSGQWCNFSGKGAVIDTGTTFMLLPPADSKQLHAQIPQSQQDGEVFHIPCSTQMPIQVVISGVAYNITPADYIGKAVKGGNLCESNIIGRQAFGPDEWLLGDVFLKNVYTVFDMDRERIGFGMKDHTSAFMRSAGASPTASSTRSTEGSATASSSTPTARPPKGSGSSPSGTAPSDSGTGVSSKPSGAGTSGAAATNHIRTLIPFLGVFSLYLLLSAYSIVY